VLARTGRHLHDVIIVVGIAGVRQVHATRGHQLHLPKLLFAIIVDHPPATASGATPPEEVQDAALVGHV
jgi:hypothetical protein